MPRGSKKNLPSKAAVESREEQFDDEENLPDSQQSSAQEGETHKSL